MSTVQKRKILGALLLVSLLILFLAAGLPGLQFRPGNALPLLLESSEGAGDVRPPDFSDPLFKVLQGLLVLLFILIAVQVVISLFDQSLRKRSLLVILMIAALIFIVSWLAENKLPQQLEETGSQPAGATETEEIETDLAAPLSFEARPRPWMLWLTIIGIAGTVAAATLLGIRSFSQRAPKRPSPIKKFADQAQAALNEIEKREAEIGDVIIRCYVEMNRTIQAENGIQREQTMTTSEFGKVLLSKGFPSRPVEQLTELFEQVRYGRQQLEANERQIAVDSLTEIAQFCRGAA